MSPRSLSPIAALLVVLGAQSVASSGEKFLYRRDSNGTLVLTNVPDHQDLRNYGRGRNGASLHRGESFRDLIETIALEQGVHPDLIFAMTQVESNFDPWAVSIKGAQGLMQLMPATADRLGVANPFDPTQNIRGGARYLRHLLDRFRGDIRLALAAYNAGESAVLAADGIPPYRETRNYVRKVLRLFGGERTPYVEPGRRRRQPSGGVGQVTIYTYTDERGVVHFTDQPPTGAASKTDRASAPR
jgi:hypothetical protein